jgi:chromosome segregation ATPase
MFVDLPQNLIVLVAGAFLLGWLLSYVSSRLGSKYRAMKRDSRDDRIRALEAELRVARTDSEYSRGDCAKLEEDLKETTVGLERRDNVITEQMEKLEVMSKDLKESVIKTRELRTELADRATENIQAEAKIREVQTELSVAQAAGDMLATGVLEYDVLDSGEDDERSEVNEATN